MPLPIAYVGQTLPTTTGTWNETMLSFTYQWNRSGTPIVGATLPSYLIVPADQGNVITVSVTATNSFSQTLVATSAGVFIGIAAGIGAFPPDSGIINVRFYGAVGDGVADDTAAILRAIAQIPAYTSAHPYQTSPIYFPNGTYKVSNTINRLVPGTWSAGSKSGYKPNLVLIGQSRAGTTIKLADSAAGYNNPLIPKAVIFTTSGLQFGSDPNNGGRDYIGLGEGNEAFNNSIENLTIDCGTGNSGAVGIDYLANNMSHIRDVLVKTSGPATAGILMTRRWCGCCLVTKTDVAGPFKYGMDIFTTIHSITLEHITITGTTGYGLRNTQNCVWFNDLTVTTGAGVGIANIDPGPTNPSQGTSTPFGPLEGLMVGVKGTIAGTGSAPLTNAASRNFKGVNVVNFQQTAFSDGGTDVFTNALSGTPITGNQGYYIRVVISPSNLIAAPGDTKVQVTLSFSTGTNNGTLTNAYIGETGTPNEWDFNGTQVQLLFAGVTSVTGITGSAIIVSDPVSFPSYDPTKKLVLSLRFDGTTVNAKAAAASGNNQYYFLAAGSGETGLSNPPGMDAGSTLQSGVTTFVSDIRMLPTSAPPPVITTINQNLDGVFHGATQVATAAWTLPVLDPPAIPLPTAPWTGLYSLGASGSADATQELRTLLNGSGVVYIPNIANGRWVISGPITVGDNVDEIEGCFSTIVCQDSTEGLTHYGVFVTSLTRTKPLFIRRLIIELGVVSTGIDAVIMHNGPCTIVPHDIVATQIAFMVRAAAGGQVFAEDIAATHLYTSGPAGIWMRLFDPETGSLKITNAGTPLWMMGLNTEIPSPALVQTAGSVTEIVGGFFYPGGGESVDTLITNTDGVVRAALATNAYSFGEGAYPVILASTLSGVTKILPRTSFPMRGPFNAVTAAYIASDALPVETAVFTNLTIPLISGGAPVNFTVRSILYAATVSANVGTWQIVGAPEGYPGPTSYKFQWYRDGVAIAGASGTVPQGPTSATVSYQTVTADSGHNLSVGIKATNNVGDSAEALSAAVGPVTATTFDPTAIAGMKLWFDASDTTTYTQSGGTVSQWNDLSGNVDNATQATVGNRPTVIAAGQNGRNIFQFTAANSQSMTLAANVNVDAAYSILAVVKYSGIVELFGNLVSDQAVGLDWFSNGVLYSHNLTNYVRGDGFGTDGRFHVVRIDLTGATGHIYIDGVDHTNTVYPFAGSAAIFTVIGQGGPPSNLFSNGQIAECALYNSVLSTPNGQEWESYLRSKWGTP